MIKRIFLWIIVALCIQSLSAQDLLESTLRGLPLKKSDKTNLVAKSVLEKSQFETTSLFSYAGNYISEEDKKYVDQVIRIEKLIFLPFSHSKRERATD